MVLTMIQQISHPPTNIYRWSVLKRVLIFKVLQKVLLSEMNASVKYSHREPKGSRSKVAGKQFIEVQIYQEVIYTTHVYIKKCRFNFLQLESLF